MEFLAEQRSQLLQVREVAGACLQKVRVQDELSTQVILDGFEMLLCEPGNQKGSENSLVCSSHRDADMVRIPSLWLRHL